MSGAFLDRATATLRLSEEQQRWLLAGSIRSFDALHAVLMASPSWRGVAAFGAEKLLAGIEAAGDALLSDPYRRALAAPAPAFPISGAAPPPARESGQVPVIRREVPGWPSSGLPPALGEEAADLLDTVLQRWPVLGQDKHGAACVGFAAAAATERLRTAAGGARPPSLSAVFVYQRIFARFPQGSTAFGAMRGGEDGPTRLSEAAAVLHEDGICPRAVWPHDSPPGARPDAAALAAALPNRLAAASYWDLDEQQFIRPPAVARTVLDLLKAGRPVAVSMPEFRDPQAAEGVTNWRNPASWASGAVLERQQGWEMAPSGHAVCILAFRPDAGAPGGGWFIFRNSWGLLWASGAPDEGADAPVPQPGYGALSAQHVEQHVWEIFSPAP